MKQNSEKQDTRSYLLGTLPRDRQADLEARLLSDREVYEELLVTEDELIDQSVAGGFSKMEQHSFETHFLITPQCQEKLRFGRHLRRYVNSNPVAVPQEERLKTEPHEVPSSNSTPFFFWPFSRNPMLAFSMILVVCLGIIAVYWLVIKRQQADYSPQRTRQTLVVVLASGSTRSGGTIQRISTPARDIAVQLELELATSDFQSYKAELLRESESLKTLEELKPEARGGHQTIPVIVDGEILGPGDYQVKLSGISDSGHTEFIGSYSFRVIAN